MINVSLAFALIKEGSDEVVAYACSKCGTVAGSVRTHGDKAKAEAEQHCGPWVCEKCGKQKRYKYSCGACLRVMSSLRDARVLDEAEDVTATYDTHVIVGGRYYFDIDEARESVDEPTWAWACTRVPPLHLDAVDIAQGAFSEYHEDAGEDADTDALQALLDTWCEDNDVESYIEDNTRKVLLTPEVYND